MVDRGCHLKGPEGRGRDEGGKGGGGSQGHRVVGGREDGLEPKGGVRFGARSIATGLGRKPVGGCYSAEMRRPAIRSTAHEPIRLEPRGGGGGGGGYSDWLREEASGRLL